MRQNEGRISHIGALAMTTEQQATLRRLAMADYNAAIERRAPGGGSAGSV